MQRLKKLLATENSRATAVLAAIVAIGVGTFGVSSLKQVHAVNHEKSYFTKLPDEVKSYYLPQLAIFETPAPAGLWQTQCYQDVGYADITAPIICGVVANQLFGATMSLNVAQAKFQKLTTLARKQGFTNVKLATNYKPVAGNGIYNTATDANITILLHFTATGPDKYCSVSTDYGSPNMLAPNPYLTVPTDLNGQAITAIYYDFECSKQLVKKISKPTQNEYLFPGTSGGYPLTQDHYGSSDPFVISH